MCALHLVWVSVTFEPGQREGKVSIFNEVSVFFHCVLLFLKAKLHDWMWGTPSTRLQATMCMRSCQTSSETSKTREPPTAMSLHPYPLPGTITSLQLPPNSKTTKEMVSMVSPSPNPPSKMIPVRIRRRISWPSPLPPPLVPSQSAHLRTATPSWTQLGRWQSCLVPELVVRAPSGGPHQPGNEDGVFCFHTFCWTNLDLFHETLKPTEDCFHIDCIAAGSRCLCFSI